MKGRVPLHPTFESCTFRGHVGWVIGEAVAPGTRANEWNGFDH